MDFWKKNYLKENFLIHKSRLKWLRDGDRNSKFFHVVIKSRKRKKFIGTFVDEEGSVVKGVKEVNEGIISHFKMAFSETESSLPILEDVPLRALSPYQSRMLESPFSSFEIKAVVWDCEVSKRRYCNNSCCICCTY